MTDKQIKAVIFDLDGTLLDTLDDLTDAVNHALNALGREGLSRERVRRFVGNGVPKLIERALFYTECGNEESGGERPRSFDECLRLFTRYYDNHNADKTKPYNGIADMINAVKAQGIKTAIVTNKYDGAAQALKSRFFGGIDVAVGTSDDIRPKPATDGVDKAFGMLGVDAARSVYVGDGETDVATARNCGMRVIAVSWGFRDRDVLESLKPDIIIDDPSEIIAALDDLARA